MKGLFIAVVLAALCVFVVHSSLPTLGNKSSLRFYEVTEELLADNSVSASKIQEYSVGTSKLQRKSVTDSILASNSVYDHHLSPNSVTSLSAAIDLVQIHWDSQNVFPADGAGPIPDGPTSIQPIESQNGDVIIDNPDRANAYSVQGYARGPGVILGWYPNQNGHLLRYQSARALRAITCADVSIRDIILTHQCVCSTNCACSVDDHGCGCSTDCACSVDYTYDHTDFIRDFGDNSQADDAGGIPKGCDFVCTAPADICNSFNFQDPQCLRQPADYSLSPNQPDNCHEYTSVEDVNNPQEGVPIYAPSVESISIDDTGIVRVNFFGRGISSITEADPEIDITVVVLLDEQYGA